MTDLGLSLFPLFVFLNNVLYVQFGFQECYIVGINLYVKLL